MDGYISGIEWQYHGITFVLRGIHPRMQILQSISRNPEKPRADTWDSTINRLGLIVDIIYHLVI